MSEAILRVLGAREKGSAGAWTVSERRTKTARETMMNRSCDSFEPLSCDRLVEGTFLRLLCQH
jgi:hypothetical protein